MREAPPDTNSVEPYLLRCGGRLYLCGLYAGHSVSQGLKNAFVKVLRLSDLAAVGNLSAEKALGETGLLGPWNPRGQYDVQTANTLSFWKTITDRKSSCFVGNPEGREVTR